MASSTEYIICPYCKSKSLTNQILGTSGVINTGGTERSVNCKKCGKDFICEVAIKLTFKTRKTRKDY